MEAEIRKGSEEYIDKELDKLAWQRRHVEYKRGLGLV